MLDYFPDYTRWNIKLKSISEEDGDGDEDLHNLSQTGINQFRKVKKCFTFVFNVATYLYIWNQKWRLKIIVLTYISSTGRLSVTLPSVSSPNLRYPKKPITP